MTDETPRASRALAASFASVVPPLVALLSAMAVASALVLAAGGAPLHVYGLLLAGTWGTPYGAGQVLFKATPLILTGLAVALPYRAGLFNVGAEGQALLGGFAAGVVGASLPAGLPAPLAVGACLVAAFAGGAVAGLVPGALKAYRGAHEVIVTIMINFVIAALLSDLGKRFYEHETVHFAAIPIAARLPLASALVPGLHGSALSAALLIALACAAAVSWLFARTALGFRLRAVGLAPEVARAAGVPIAREIVIAMTLGGGLAGLVGAQFVLGYKHYYEEGFTGGVGFVGIAVALLGRGRALGIVLASLLFGTLSQGGLAINAAVPKDLVDVVQAVIILAVAAAGAGPFARRAGERP